MLTERGCELAEMDPKTAAQGWDLLKTEIRQASLRLQREKRATATRSYRTRIKRLHDSLRRAKLAASWSVREHAPSVDTISQGMDVLTLDAAERVERLRRQLISVKLTGAAARRRVRFANYAGPAHMTARAFYKRISMKFAKRTCSPLAAQHGCSLSSADRLARDWQPIIQQPPRDVVTQDEFFQSLQKRPVYDFSGLSDEISAAEVVEAIKHCPRGKACGPDGLPNDWYRELADEIAEVLAPLFTVWYRGGALPDSFKGATIYCLPKIATPQTGLDYRPIALLNSDYKIYARVLLNRIRGHVSGLVPATQYGFVPGRQVHDAIDVWTAVQHRVSRGLAPDTTTAIMLDFSKAYDTLDRRFLRLAMNHHGFPAEMVDAVDAMHLSTTARFLADGELSTRQQITAGIRQGCPLAPTLFVLAVAVLYEVVDGSSALLGVSLADNVQVKLVGFADDTTAYVTSCVEATSLKGILREFESVSGLSVNMKKSRAVSARTQGFPEGFSVGFPSTSVEELFRYLGAMIASNTNQRHVWDVAVRQLTARLHLAAIKTTNVLQRVQITRTIIVPKILFVARHCWPSADQIKRLQKYVHDYVWLGTTAAEASGRAWMSKEVASAPHGDGGLQVPIIQHELMLLSVRTVEHWLTAKSSVGRAVGVILMKGNLRCSQTSYQLAFGRGRPGNLAIGSTLAATGLTVLRRVYSTRHTPSELGLSRTLRSGAGVGSSRTLWWQDGWLHRDYTEMTDRLRELRQYQEEALGRLNVHGLRFAALLEDGLLFSRTDEPLKVKHLPGLCVNQARVCDVVDWEWVQHGQLRFRYCAGEVDNPKTARSFRILCDLLVFNYPAILRRPDPFEVLSATPASETIWSIRKEHHAVYLLRDPGPAVEQLGKVETLNDVERLARRVEGTRVRFLPHPDLSPVLPLWDGKVKLQPKFLRRTLSAAWTTQAKKENAARQRRSREQHPAIADALERVPWRKVHVLNHSSSSQRLLFHRIKGLRLQGWDRKHQKIGCPHCPALGKGGGIMSHIMWECPQAQRLWRNLRDHWRLIGGWTGSDATTEAVFRDAAFSLALSAVPPRVWRLPTLVKLSTSDHRATTEVYPVLNNAWQQQVLITFQTIQRWRQGMHDPDRAWGHVQALAIHSSMLRGSIRQLAHTFSDDTSQWRLGGPLLGEIYTLYADAPQGVVSPDAEQDRHNEVQEATPGKESYLLFFDGGSRGNPGPGGSGAVIVVTDQAASRASIVWSSSISFANPKTTNNQAEYQGLIAGLKAAHDAKWYPLEVIGDSALILRQLQQHRPPLNHKLLPLYATARRLADTIPVTQWHHHIRAFNKMADLMANVAMDAKSSIQVRHPTQRGEHNGLDGLLAGDFSHWQDSVRIAREPAH